MWRWHTSGDGGSEKGQKSKSRVCILDRDWVGVGWGGKVSNWSNPANAGFTTQLTQLTTVLLVTQLTCKSSQKSMTLHYRPSPEKN